MTPMALRYYQNRCASGCWSLIKEPGSVACMPVRYVGRPSFSQGGQFLQSKIQATLPLTSTDS
jgi:hypothetical protein